MASETVRLRVEGMGCDGCVAAVAEALRKVHGVRAVAVELAAGAAKVVLGQPVDPAHLVAAVEHAGYDAALA